ncbi:DUF927 domain-containing protein [Streptomyces sp. S1A]|uniref:DUF927 domain-containing protein n=1 Tax=Streptomyces sp. ICN903 TaxID=2964654 RepID=UPI001EDA9109|nr:DUF927 domain-containing protein [Streptomyces sp. ICN903]MCG3039180.1 DUF927 domain-containing protein [Streptomyces sp. ICN903]
MTDDRGESVDETARKILDENGLTGFPPALLALVRSTDGPAYRVPAGYRVDYSGVWAVRETKDGEILTRVAWAPLLVATVYVDPAGDQNIELAWMDRGRPVTRTVPRSVARRGRLLVATLGDAGLPVIEADAKQAERWLAAVESANYEAIPRVDLARQLGWQKNGAFVTSQDTPNRVEVKYEEQKSALAAHVPCGTLEGWQRAIKPMDAYPVAQMALYACLAAPLLEPVGVNSFTVDISGRSTRGKTTAAMGGMSVWADPSEKADGMYSWRTTMLAAEKRLNLVNGLPVVFDETKLVRDPEMVHALLYQIPKNHGQARGGGWPSGLPWRTVVLSTGEQSVLTFTTDQGAAARVLQLKAAPFGTGGAESAAAAIEVRDGCSENYGVAGPQFIEKLLALLADGGKARLLARHRELTEAHRYESDMSARRAPMVACLALAAELAHSWGIVPFPPPQHDVWAQLFAASDQTDNRGEMALDVVREYVASHRREVWSPHTADEQPFSGWIGRELQVDGKTTMALLPERLKEALRRAGYELESVIPSWRESGALVESPSYRPPYLLAKKLNGPKVRMYVFAPSVFAADDEDGE